MTDTDESDNEAMESDNEGPDAALAESVAARRVAEDRPLPAYMPGDFQRMVAAMSPRGQAAITYVQVDCVEQAAANRRRDAEQKLRKAEAIAERQRQYAEWRVTADAAERRRQEAAEAAERDNAISVNLDPWQSGPDPWRTDGKGKVGKPPEAYRRSDPPPPPMPPPRGRGRGGVPWRQDQQGGCADNSQAHQDHDA